MVPVKSLLTLLKALAEMTWTPLPKLLLVGDGPERESLEQLAKSLGIWERVRFQGFVENTLPSYREMDLSASPSYHEGIPIALLEALGARLPVVASSVGGIPYVIGATGAGCPDEFVVASAWANAITELLRDRAKMKMLGERARAHIQAKFSIDEMARRYVMVYQSVMA